MTPSPTPTDNTPRPASFDARIMAYRPGLRAMAAKYRRTAEDREDLVNDTIMCCLDSWRSYRKDGGFWLWLYWNMRGCVSNDAIKKKRREGLKLVNSDFHYDNAATPPSQRDYVELSAALRHLTGRGGMVVLRRSMGDTLPEIAKDLGLSRERVRQIEEKERARLRRVMGRR